MNLGSRLKFVGLLVISLGLAVPLGACKKHSGDTNVLDPESTSAATKTATAEEEIGEIFTKIDEFVKASKKPLAAEDAETLEKLRKRRLQLADSLEMKQKTEGEAADSASEADESERTKSQIEALKADLQAFWDHLQHK